MAFASVGIVTPLLAGIVMPLCRLLPGSPADKDVRAQRAIHWATRFFAWELEALRVTRIEWEGVERLKAPGILVVATHPTLMDALILMSQMPQADCVIKGSHFDHTILGPPSRRAGYIPNHDGPSLVEACAARLRAGRSVIIFPEGTRSPANDLGPFNRGAAHIALRAGCDPVPVTIRCHPATLYRGLAWWDVPDRRFTLSLSVGDPIPVKDVVNQSMSRPRAARTLTAHLRDYFERRVFVV